MRLALMSDLHLEIDRRHGIAGAGRSAGHPELGPDLSTLQGATDLCILAGDIDRGMAAMDYARAVAAFLDVPTVLVAGNHEFYGHRRSDLLADYRAAAAASAGRVHFLENDAVALRLGDGPLRVLGCTLWTDLALYGAAAAEALAASAELQQIYDYKRIRADGGATIGVGDPVDWHRTSRAWLEANLGADGVRTLVVTHHAVSPRSIAPRFHGSPLNAVFACDLEPLIRRTGPAMWLHGHTHHDVDYRLGRTRVVSCQRGYPSERDGSFAPRILAI